jgi:hypothetical protein
MLKIDLFIVGRGQSNTQARGPQEAMSVVAVPSSCPTRIPILQGPQALEQTMNKLRLIEEGLFSLGFKLIS